MNAHNGRVWVKSKGEGEGSTFYIEIKALKTEEKDKETQKTENVKKFIGEM